MARLTRKNQKVFAESATNNGVFGSLQAGNPELSNDIEKIQSLPAYSQGWNAATMTSELLPPLEEFQAIQYMITRQMSYFFQEGIPEWGEDVTFYEGSLTKENIAGGMRVYSSKTNENKGNALTDTTNWQKVFDTSDPYAFTNWVNQQLALKEDLSNKINNLTNPSATTYPTTQAVANAINSIDLTPYQLKSNLINNLTNPSATTYPTTQAVATGLNLKEGVSNKVTNFNNPNNTTYPTTAAVDSRITTIMDSKLIPNTSAFQYFENPGPWVIPASGYINVTNLVYSMLVEVFLNGVSALYIRTFGADGHTEGRWCGTIIVGKGQVVTFGDNRVGVRYIPWT